MSYELPKLDKLDQDFPSKKWFDMATDHTVYYEMPIIKSYGKTDDSGLGLILDVETTGLDADVDEITEMGILPFTFCKNTLKICDVLEPVVSFRDPGIDIPLDVQTLTGITNEMVKGAHFPKEKFQKYFGETNFITAHNAAFDREFVEKLFGKRDMLWTCSMIDINWDEMFGRGKKTLDHLSLLHGFYSSNAHRTEIDCRSVLHLLAHNNYLSDMLNNAAMPTYKIECAFRYDKKKSDFLKSKGFNWNPNRKVWWKNVTENDLDTVSYFLKNDVYDGDEGWTETPIHMMRRFRK